MISDKATLRGRFVYPAEKRKTEEWRYARST